MDDSYLTSLNGLEFTVYFYKFSDLTKQQETLSWLYALSLSCANHYGCTGIQSGWW